MTQVIKHGMAVETGTWKNQTKVLTNEPPFLAQFKKHFLYNDQIM